MAAHSATVESARAVLGRRRSPLRLVIFDCDGVLIDSEPVANRVVAEELTRLGWPTTPEESRQRFLGLDLTAMVPMIEAGLRRKLPPDWPLRLQQRLVAAMRAEAALVAGAREALEAVAALGLAWRVASNSSHEEMAAKFGRNGLADMVVGRLHSFTDVARGKPAPDLFLAAAAAQRVHAAECLVVEDSIPGIEGAVTAGMDCLGLTRRDGEAAFAAAGALPFHSLFELPGLLRAALGRSA